MTKKALITGITGQDGSYLAEFLLSKGYEVHGIIRRASNFNTQRIDHIFRDPHNSDVKLFLHFGDVTDYGSICDVIQKTHPDEIYHLAAQSHVRVSFDMPSYTGMATGLGTTHLLEAIKQNDIETKFYQASSSEMFGSSPPPQNEETPFRPRSPYAAAKVYSFYMTINYREAYNMYTCNGILFNHESPRRGKTFVTRKITQALSKIYAKEQNFLYLGNLDAKRDWGYAPEYVEVMWKMLQLKTPDDFVCGTGETHSIREFLDEAFGYLDMDWNKFVKIDPRYFRPTEVEALRSDPSKAFKKLGWKPIVTFKELIKIMVDYDMKSFGLEPPGEGIAYLEKKKMNWTSHQETLG